MRPTRANMPVDAQLRNVRRVLTNISFGQGNTDQNKNILGWDSGNITTPATANTAFTVNHSLGYVPTRFQVHYNNSAGVVYDSGTAWTTSTISLKCSAASATIRVFII
jgi:hypothetical protein